MLFAETLGVESFRQRVKIYATDVDEDALTEARAAAYDAKAVESVPPDLLNKYFEQVNGHYVFHKDLRRAVIFGRNDLVKDAPISRVDLLVCRNTLMYINAETQRNVLARLHFALAPTGHAVSRPRRDVVEPRRPVHAIESQAPGLPQGSGLTRRSANRYELGATMYERHGDLPGLNTVRDLAFRRQSRSPRSW